MNNIVNLSMVGLFLYNCSVSYVRPSYNKARYLKMKLETVELETWFLKRKTSETVLLLHGGPGVPDYLYPVAKKISQNGHNVILFNQRGTGNSVVQNDDYSIKSLLNDIDNIRKNYKLKKIHLFGHLFGGLLALYYYQARPSLVKSLFLSSPSTGSTKDWEKMESQFITIKNSGHLPWLQNEDEFLKIINKFYGGETHHER